MSMKLLGERAVRANAFKPMNGMLMRSPVVASRIWRMDQGDHNGTWDDRDKENWYLDMLDVASLGCLLALYDNTRKTNVVPDPVYTLAAAYGLTHERTCRALVAALEAAP